MESRSREVLDRPPEPVIGGHSADPLADDDSIEPPVPPFHLLSHLVVIYSKSKAKSPK
jgi:hypothetical protein